MLGYVGKAVTFDSGGISIKPGNKMSDMKFDMSGGAAVLGATAAIARLNLPVKLIAVIGATENLPSGRSMKPGDILRARNGTTIEVINTDAEGRLVLADCLHHAVEQGAERLVDLATLTGAIVTTLGTTYAGLMGTDDEWCEEVSAAGRRAGEILWRLPLHPEYADLIKGRYGDIVNAVENRRAASVTAAEFLHRFVGDVPPGLPGRTSTSRASRGTPTRPTRPRAATATASACWSSWRSAHDPPPEHFTAIRPHLPGARGVEPRAMRSRTTSSWRSPQRPPLTLAAAGAPPPSPPLRARAGPEHDHRPLRHPRRRRRLDARRSGRWGQARRQRLPHGRHPRRARGAQDRARHASSSS